MSVEASRHLATASCIRLGAFTKPSMRLATTAASKMSCPSTISDGMTRYPIRSPGRESDFDQE